MADNIVVAAKVRELAKAEGINTGGDFIEAFDKEVRALIKKACARVKGRKQKTLQAFDA